MAGDSLSFGLVVTSLVLWGSWANSYKIAQMLYNMDFEIYFLGFSIAATCCSLLGADAINDSFWRDKRYFDYHFQMAIIAGAIANIGKVCITGAIALTGMTVAIPLVLGIEIFLGTILLYLGDPQSANPYYLFTGVVLILMAVIFDVLFQLQADADRASDGKGHPLTDKLMYENSESHSRQEGDALGATIIGRYRGRTSHSNSRMRSFMGKEGDEQSSNHAWLAAKLGFTTVANRSRERETRPQKDDKIDNSFVGILFALVSGLCLATWPVIYEIDEDISWKEFYCGFTLSLGLTSCITLPTLSLLRKVDWSQMNVPILALGMIGGFMMCSSLYLMFASQEGLHFIVSMTIVRCSPVISAFWGITLWDEVEGASSLAITYIGIMFLLYLAAIVFIALSILTMEEDMVITGSLAH